MEDMTTKPAANTHGDFIWYELMTIDTDAAQGFYGPLLGWQFAKSSTPGMDYRLVSMNGAEIAGLLALSKEMRQGGARPLWAGYVGVDDVDASCRRITASGGAVMMPPTDLEGVGRLAFVADPQGAPLYVMTPTPPADNPKAVSESFAIYEAKEGHCAWNELCTADPAAADVFYSALFGWEKADALEMGGQGLYQMYQQNDYVLGAIMPKPEQMPVSLWGYYFRVADIDQAAGYVKDNGGQLMLEPTEIPGGDYIISAVDPQGAMFNLIGKR